MSYADSICIQFLSPSLIIYGKGNKLFIQNEKFKENLELKTYDKIHKITFLDCGNNTYKIACSAGREVLLTKVSENKFHGGFITKFNDWISSTRYLSNGTIAIITCHNIASLLEIEENKLVIRESLKCDDNSTLYCSWIHGNVWSDLIFFSGTALGELIIWKKNAENAETLYQKSTHNGVIFSIHYYEDFVVTASDDRSIKIYRPNESFSELKELRQLFGHTSRVFVGKIIKYKDEIMFVSAGEDSNVCFWSENGMLKSKKNISASGCIWDLGYDPENARIVTCSSTGKLNQFLLHKMFYETHNQEIISACGKIEPSKLLYLENGTLCVLDSKMEIYTKSCMGKEWAKVDQPKNPHIFGMDVFENRLFLATKNSVLIFDYSNICDKLNFTLELNVDEKFSKESYLRAIHVLNRNEIFLSDVLGSCMVVNVESNVVKNLFKIPKSSEPWTTSIAKMNDYWIIADRVGSLYLYRNLENDLSTYQSPIQKLSKLHGQTGVTTIRAMENGFIRTTGNDGTIKTLRLNKKTSQLEFYHLERTHVHFIEKVREYKSKSYVFGFNDNYFVMYKDREIIYEHRCGGRHRHWDVTLINKDDCKVQFAYIYKKQVHCVEFYLNNFNFDTPINDKSDILWHTKQSNVLKVIDDLGILISGGEDTLLKLTKIEMIEDGVLYTKIADVNSHISSIKAIVTWRENDADGEKGGDLYIISMGGRAQIVMTKVIKMKYVKEEINFMLTNSMLCGNSKESTFDPETRFTCAFYDVKRRHLFVGCSDGYLRVFKLLHNEFSSSLKPLIESFYGRCILHITKIESFIVTMATDGIVCFWYFNEMQKEAEHGQIQKELTIIYKLQHNQNGINCFDVYKIDTDHYKIATSGDDSGVYVTEFEIVDNSLIKCYKTIKTYEIHIAQVTGIKFIAHDELLTASVDQTVCKVKINSDNFAVADKRFTCISDVKGFSLFGKKYIFVHGAGLEALPYF